MLARVWGCRGSLPAPGPETVRYGGNTSCVELRLSDGTLVILDAGTGLRPLGRLLEQDPVERIHIVLTHLHLDHILGLGFFPQLFNEGVEVHLWGPRSPLDSLAERIARYLSPPLFPVHVADMQSRVYMHDVTPDGVEIGSAWIHADLVSHQGPTLGVRVEDVGASLAYIPDHEPAMGTDMASLEAEWLSGFRIAQSADVLLHDAQYTDAEYRDKVGWGHSSVGHAVSLAQRSGARRLVLFHHDPMHTDDDLERMLDSARAAWGSDAAGPVLAYEGMEITLGAASDAATA